MKARCNTCKGMRKIPGLGFIKKTCPECDGTGLIEIEDVPCVTPDPDNAKLEVETKEKVVPKKRRGRPPKAKSTEE